VHTSAIGAPRFPRNFRASSNSALSLSIIRARSPPAKAGERRKMRQRLAFSISI
jgi:hypothetical protein